MRRPQNRGSPIDMRRMRDWVSEFAGYRIGINDGRVDRWLSQFEDTDKDIAARILDSIDYVSQQQMAAAFRDVLNGLPGWSQNSSERVGKWRFVAFSGSAGESGDTMLHIFRRANNLANSRFNELFIHRSDLLRESFEPEDTVVFIDDFTGTGNQACRAWQDTFAELLPSGPNSYLMLIRASDKAAQRISEETELQVAAHNILTESDDIFSPRCTYFNAHEKDRILHYCRSADRENPRGFGNCGMVVVFQHSCPNNSIPILHVTNQHWVGVFQAFD